MTCTLLVRGVKTRNPRQINPSFLLFCITTTLALIGLIDKRSTSAFVIFVFHFYILVVLFSLKKKFQEEQQGRGHYIIHQPQFIMPVTVHQQKA
jgi:Ca2+/Na+ antiporter